MEALEYVDPQGGDDLLESVQKSLQKDVHSLLTTFVTHVRCLETRIMKQARAQAEEVERLRSENDEYRKKGRTYAGPSQNGGTGETAAAQTPTVRSRAQTPAGEDDYNADNHSSSLEDVVHPFMLEEFEGELSRPTTPGAALKTESPEQVQNKLEKHGSTMTLPEASEPPLANARRSRRAAVSLPLEGVEGAGGLFAALAFGSGDKGRAAFADASAMKDKIREAVTKKEYNVCDLYWPDSCCANVARSVLFEYATLVVISCNALWIAIDTDGNDAALLLHADPMYQIAEHLFCTYFTGELLIRFGAFVNKRSCLSDPWFCFDAVLVIMMVAETWVMTLMILMIGVDEQQGIGNTSLLKLLRVARCTRMARMARLMRAVPELVILVKGIAVAARSVCFTIVLLFIIMYVYAILVRQLVPATTSSKGSEIETEFFPSVPKAMFVLLLDGVLPDQSPLVRACEDENWFLVAAILSFVMLASLTVMNMLVGVLCEVVSVVSSVEKEQLTVRYVKTVLQRLFDELALDDDQNLKISRREFEALLMNVRGAQIIDEIGVDVVGLADMTDYIFQEDGETKTFGEFMDLILQLRGSNTSTVKDIVDMRRQLVTEFGKQEKLIERLFEQQSKQSIAVAEKLALVNQQAGADDRKMTRQLLSRRATDGAIDFPSSSLISTKRPSSREGWANSPKADPRQPQVSSEQLQQAQRSLQPRSPLNALLQPSADAAVDELIESLELQSHRLNSYISYGPAVGFNSGEEV
jgi:hypothetical protein